MNNAYEHWLNCARHTRCLNERTMEMASGAMLWHIPSVQISQQWLWPLRRSSGTAQKDNNNSGASHTMNTPETRMNAFDRTPA